MALTECPHKTLTKQKVGDTHFYTCPNCGQKFLEQKWDGKMEVVTYGQES